MTLRFQRVDAKWSTRRRWQLRTLQATSRRPEPLAGRAVSAASVSLSIRADRVEGRRDGAPWGNSSIRPPPYPKRGGAQTPTHVGCRQHLAWTLQGPEAHRSASRAECHIDGRPHSRPHLKPPGFPRLQGGARCASTSAGACSYPSAWWSQARFSPLISWPRRPLPLVRRPAHAPGAYPGRTVDRQALPAADRPPAAGHPLRHPPERLAPRPPTPKPGHCRRCRPAGDDLIWQRLRNCEAGGRYDRNSGNGYYGAYQFSAGTWRSLGYKGLPHQAPPEVQDEAARKLQARSGWGQWPACSRRIGAR